MRIVTKFSHLLAMITLIYAYKRVRIGANSKNAQHKVIGGQATTIRDYPFMIKLVIKVKSTSFLCGATYIKPMWVITAAHCLDINDQRLEKPPSTGKKDRVKCIAGYEEKRQTRTYQRLYSANLFINPTYFRNATDTNNDIGLIQLSEPFVLNEAVQMIDMPNESIDYSGGEVTLLGWGATKTTDDPGAGIITYAKKLQVLHTTVQNMKACLRGVESASAICVGRKGNIACSGDSGGPLVYRKMLIGVCSYGFGCGDDMVVYENIYFHMEWIRNVTEYTARRGVTRSGDHLGATSDTVSKILSLLLFWILNLPLRLD